MIGIDANVLVALASATHQCHANVVAAFQRELDADEEIVLSLSVVAEFLPVVTDARRITPALTMADAIVWLRHWNSAVVPIWLASNDSVVELWLKWMMEFQLGRKRILDTQFAALLYAHGVKRLLTNSAPDFQIFKVFEIITF